MKRMVFNNFSELAFDLAGYDKLEVFLWEQFGKHYEFSTGLHGAPHWLSAYDNALKLLDLVENDIFPEQRNITLIAAYLHDVGRLIYANDIYTNMHHSSRSEAFIRRNLINLGLNLSGTEIEWVALLARGHYLAKDTYTYKRELWQMATKNRMDLCLKIVRDADALDRIRFNGLDISFLHLPVSCSLVNYVTEKWNGGYKVIDFD